MIGREGFYRFGEVRVRLPRRRGFDPECRTTGPVLGHLAGTGILKRLLGADHCEEQQDEPEQEDKEWR